jgi:deazaflavin-dependent oxidoreductase (nitroreductase family)
MNANGTDESTATGPATAPKKPPAWFVHTAWRVHRTLYRLTGGRFLWATSNKRGWGAMQLVTTGRHTGRDRMVIIGYIEDGSNLVALAMNGWDEGHPAWWLNLIATPRASIGLTGQDRRAFHAREALGDERARLWQRWLETDPNLLAFAAERATPTPVVVFEPAGR